MGFNPSIVYNVQGQLIQWTATARNNGSSVSNNVVMALTLPDELSIFDVNVQKGTYSIVDKKWYIGSLLPGEQVLIKIYFNTNVIPNGDLSIVSVISGTGTDSSSGNNTQTDTLTYTVIDNFIHSFILNGGTAYVSQTRNLNNSIGTPTVGDLSRCWNTGSGDFVWSNLNIFSSRYLHNGYYTNPSFTGGNVFANGSNILQLTANAATVRDVKNIAGASNISNGACIHAEEIEGILLLTGTGSTVNVCKIVGGVDFAIKYTGSTSGKSIFNIDNLNRGTSLTYANSVTFASDTSITLNINNLDAILTIDSINLGDVNLVINVENCTPKGKIKFNAVQVNDSTKIVVQGDFKGLSAVDTNAIITMKSMVNNGSQANRINIVNSSFKTDVTAIKQDTTGTANGIGFNIINCSFIMTNTTYTSTYHTFLLTQATSFFYGVVTNETTANGGSDYTITGSVYKGIAPTQNLNLV